MPCPTAQTVSQLNRVAPPDASEKIEGTVEQITFHSEESGFCVLQVRIKGKRELVTVVGAAASCCSGETIRCVGGWHAHAAYGLQFKAQQIELVLPHSLEGMGRYLASGFVKGIGPYFAKCLVAAFGAAVFEIIDQSPERLLELPGIGPHRKKIITASWGKHKAIREIMVFLSAHGVGTARAVRIYKTYGQQAIKKITENPYRLALDIRGIGFKTADALAEKLGIAKFSVLRAEAGVRHLLQDHCANGHCAMPYATLVQKGGELLEIPTSTLEEAVAREVKGGRLILQSSDSSDGSQGQLVFLKHLYQAECEVAAHLKRLQGKGFGGWIDHARLPRLIERVEKATHRVLSPSQQQALKQILTHKLLIVTGGPGVGKTTLVHSALKAFSLLNKKVLLCAPTGRAAKRLSESTGLESKTIHRLLEFDPHAYAFKRNAELPLEADLLVVDESSMVDLPLMHHLLKAIPTSCGLLLVGDVDQLPSVGPGAVLLDLIASQQVATVCLTEIFRQAQSSLIIKNAHRINQGQLPQSPERPVSCESQGLSDFYFMEAADPEQTRQRLLKIISERIPKRFGWDPVREVQVLVPMNRGSLGVRALNQDLQRLLNPRQGQAESSLMRYGTTFVVGDKLLQTVNNYQKEVFNGDIGFLSHIDKEEGMVTVAFDTRSVDYEFEELDELALAYAISIHKSQGSEYTAVVIPLSLQHYALLERNLLYTAVTRGKALVVLVGEKRALAIAVKKNSLRGRLTYLEQRLRSTF